MYARHIALVSSIFGGMHYVPIASAMASFANDSHLTLQTRNFYINQDLRDNPSSGKHKLEEWGQGFMLRFNSGYTEGPVGLGVDALGLLGMKLDSGRGTSGTGALPVSKEGDVADEFGSFGMTAKVRAGKSVLTVGTQEPVLPVAFRADNRLLPQTFEGAQLVSKDLEEITLIAGQLRSTRLRDSTGNEDMAMLAFTKGGGLAASTASERFNYAGFTYDFRPGFSATYYYAKLEDNYNQQYVELNHTLRLSDDWRLTSEARYFHSDEENNSGIDNRTLGSMFSLGFKGHTLGAGYQNQSGRTGMPFIGGTVPWARAWGIYHHFLYAGEDTWQVEYSFDLATVGIPGLTLMNRYVRGDNFQVGNAQANEYEFNTDLTYVVQSGAFKNISLRWRNVKYRGNHTVDRDGNRVIIGYTFKFW
jgi:hypothetical protein